MLADVDVCTGCSACFAACPRKAMSMLPDKDGFLFPKIDGAKCVQCGICERVCPVLRKSCGELEVDSSRDAPSAYAAITKNEVIRLESSSGGVFTELASQILKEKGCTFGCVLDARLVACHAKAETDSELSRMRGSKYVQSDLRDSFRDCKAELDNGRSVLFSGTPCQIAGLRNYLGREYPGLLTVDLICHGVPSPAVFDKYKHDVERRMESELTDIGFRSKKVSWKRFSMTHYFRDSAKDFAETLDRNSYLRVFLRNLCLRPCCATCKFRAGRSGADITIADFWGVERYLPEFSDEKGVSAVVVHTQKGRRVWTKLEGHMICKPVELASITESNPSYYHSVKIPIARERYLAGYSDKDFADFAAKVILGPIWLRALHKVKRLMKVLMP